MTVRRWIVVWLGVLAVIGACRTVPLTERKQFSLLPEATVTSLAADQYQQFLAQADVVTGTPEAEKVKRVGCRVRIAVEKYLKKHDRFDRIEGYDWQFNLVDNSAANAFAMPGGKVVVFTGILELAQNDAQLATIIAHEIAHVVAYHGNERMSQGLVAQLGGQALSAALSSEPQRTRQLFLAAYGVGAQVGVLMPYSRLHESEADHIGLLFMAEAGYDPRAAVEFWQRMKAKSEGQAPPEFLSTHPSHETRIEDLRDWMDEAMDLYDDAKDETFPGCQ